MVLLSPLIQRRVTEASLSRMSNNLTALMQFTQMSLSQVGSSGLLNVGLSSNLQG